nr:zinc finger, CCHC-type [Tanacetum cinerariifolium]
MKISGLIDQQLMKAFVSVDSHQKPRKNQENSSNAICLMLSGATWTLVQWLVVFDEVQRFYSLNGIHQWSLRKYPQQVSSSEVVSVLNYQWKKMNFMLSSMSVYVLTTPMPEDGGENPTVEQVRKRPSGTMTIMSVEESLRVQDSDKPKGNNVAGPSVVNMVEHNNSSRYNDNKGKRKHHDIRANPNKKPKVTCWKCGKPGHLNKDCKTGNIGNKANGSSTKGSEDGSSNPLKDNDVAWWVDSGVTVHVCKDRCWFKTYESLNDGSIRHMGNESTSLVRRRGCVDLRFSSGKVVSLLNVLHVPNIRKNLVLSSGLNNYGYKQVIESTRFVLSKHASLGLQPRGSFGAALDLL